LIHLYDKDASCGCDNKDRGGDREFRQWKRY